MRGPMVQALWAMVMGAALLAPITALAAPPDLDLPELAAGETDGEVSAFRSHDAWIVRPEIDFALSDALWLEVQADVGGMPGAKTKLSNVSAQLMLALSRDGQTGIGGEVGYDPDESQTGAGVFLFAARQVGPWALGLNAGVEREGGATSAVYAWHVEHDLAAKWLAGVEGGGQIAFHGGEAEHLIGPTVGARLGALELRFSWLFGSGAEDLARIGLERKF